MSPFLSSFLFLSFLGLCNSVASNEQSVESTWTLLYLFLPARHFHLLLRPIDQFSSEAMATIQSPTPKLDRYIVIHVATTCDEHGVYVTKDSAEVIELGWILLDTKSCEEVNLSILSLALTYRFRST